MMSMLTDPFLTIYQELRHEGIAHKMAWRYLVQLIDTPENRAMLMMYQEDAIGCEMLVDWHAAWAALGVQPPWSTVLPAGHVLRIARG